VPLIPRKNRYAVHGRILSNGAVGELLSIANIRQVAKTIIQEQYEAVAISFLNSYVNPIHEIRTRKLLKHMGFKGHVDISSDVNPEYREYERTSTTVVNAVLSKSISSYLTRLKKKTWKIGIRSPIYVMKSDGTAATLQQAASRPVSMIESGPAAGVLASQHLGKSLRIRRLLTFDMGGTTAKASAIINGKPDLSYEFEAAGKIYHGRSLKGSGYAVRQPFVDLAEVSSGGGTIAWVDETGTLKLGPRSAGSNPGPACYGKGGLDPTVTDANVVTGRINPRSILNGRIKIHYDLALKSISKISSGKLHTNPIKTALSLLALANNNMARALSLVSTERGRDPREYTLVAYGGAGPLHACELAQELGIRRIIVPTHPGMFSALGLITAKLSRSFARSIMRPLKTSLEHYLSPFRAQIQNILKLEEGVTKYHTIEYVDLRYQGQAYEITIPYHQNIDPRKKFDQEHRKLYGYACKDPIDIAAIRIETVYPTLGLKSIKISPNSRRFKKYEATQTSRRQFFTSAGPEMVPVYDRTNLRSGMHGKGPCIVEEYDSTTVIHRGWKWYMDEYENLDLQI
jgi:N-methylhydantoinase A